MFNFEVDCLLLLSQGNLRPKDMGNEWNSSCDTRMKNEDPWKFCSWRTFEFNYNISARASLSDTPTHHTTLPTYRPPPTHTKTYTHTAVPHVPDTHTTYSTCTHITTTQMHVTHTADTHITHTTHVYTHSHSHTLHTHHTFTHIQTSDTHISINIYS